MTSFTASEKTKVQPSEVKKGDTFFFPFDQMWCEVKVLGLRKDEKVQIEFLTGSAAGDKMTCKVLNRLYK